MYLGPPIAVLVWSKAWQQSTCDTSLMPKCSLPGSNIEVPYKWRGSDRQCQMNTLECGIDGNLTAESFGPPACELSCHNSDTYLDKHNYPCSSWRLRGCNNIVGWWGFYSYDANDARDIEMNCPGACSQKCAWRFIQSLAKQLPRGIERMRLR